MRGLCKNDCGSELEYESHEFSDGFVYYLPRDLDGTVHDCFVVNYDSKTLKDGSFRNRLDCFKKNGIAEKEAMKILEQREYRFIPFEMEWVDHDVNMVCKGKTDKLIEFVKELLSISPNPLEQRTGYYDHEFDVWFPPPYAEYSLPTPTVWGYQLERLGKLYEIITNFEDAKKCYDLQYKCTGESELLEKSKDLDKKIKERKDYRISAENIPDNLKLKDIRKKIEDTELNLRKYVVVLFSNNFTELFKKNPSLREEIQKIRSKDEESMLDFNENSDIETLSMGSLKHILIISRAKVKSNTDQMCEICKKKWKKGQSVFLEKFPKKIICVDELCFKKQGGLVKDIPECLIYRIQKIVDVRNIHDHPRSYDEEMFKLMLKEAYSTCDVINRYIENFLIKKQST